MSRIVALETSGPVGSVAVAGPDLEVVERVFERGQRHARDLVPALQELCQAAGWTPHEIEAVVVDVGPGSYTGVRVAIAAARTLAFAVDAALIGVDSLAVLAEGLGDDRHPLAVLLDARRGQAYWDLFEPDAAGGLRRRFGPGIATPEMIQTRLPTGCRLLGSGLTAHGSAFDAGRFQPITEEASWIPRASTLLEIGRRAAQAGGLPDASSVSPIYLRPSEAELLWEERHGPG